MIGVSDRASYKKPKKYMSLKCYTKKNLLTYSMKQKEFDMGMCTCKPPKICDLFTVDQKNLWG